MSIIYFPYAGYRNSNPYFCGGLYDITTAENYWINASIEATVDGISVKVGRTLYFTQGGVNSSANATKQMHF